MGPILWEMGPVPNVFVKSVLPKVYLFFVFMLLEYADLSQ
jgi:hypothetical protein